VGISAIRVVKARHGIELYRSDWEAPIYRGRMPSTIEMLEMVLQHLEVDFVQETDIEIEILEDNGWWARGHLSQQEIEAGVTSYCVDEIVTLTPVEHTWWRYIPSSDTDSTGYYIEAVPKSRGAFKVTTAHRKEA
jgi:hypothetical protein